MKESLLQSWKMKYADPIINGKLSELEAAFQNKNKEWKTYCVQEFKKFTERVLKQEQTVKTGFFIYTLLRNRVLSHNFHYCVMLYDKDWYLKEARVIGEFNADFVFQYFESAWQDLLLAARQSLMLIGPAEVEYLLLDYLPQFHNYVLEILRLCAIEITETKEYQQLEKEELFEIQAGEYFEPGDTVLREGQNKNLLQIKSWLKKNESSVYCFEDFKNLDLGGIIIHKCDLRYTDFRGSNLSDADLSGSLLIGTKFKNSQMLRANLMVSDLSDADFSRCDLTGANLQYCLSFTGKNEETEWKRAGFTGTCFDGSNLSHADFTGAVIHQVDFTTANLEGTIFDKAKLYHCCMNKKQAQQCKLSKEQMGKVILVPDG